MVNYILGNASVTVFLRGKIYTINKQAHSYNLVIEALKTKDEDKVFAAVNIRQGIANALTAKNKDVTIEDNKIFYRGREVTGLISTRIFEVIRLGLDVQPMVNFLENLMNNPSKRAVDEAFGFSESNSLPITPDGYLLAYKRVREDYYDVHSGTVLNKPYKLFTKDDIKAIDKAQGKRNEVSVTIENGFTTVSMPRNMVNEDKDQTCSEGLHFCSYEYLEHFSGERIVVLKINPADIVSIPTDYNNAKGRCSKYQIVDEIEVEGKMPKTPLQDGYINDYVPEVVEEAVPAEYTTKSKLSDYQIAKIRADIDLGASLSFLAQEYNTSRRTIARIRDRVSPYN